MTLLVTLSLVQVSIFNAVTDNSPNVEGLSSISAWVLTCILFVFGALLAYASVLLKRSLHPEVSVDVVSFYSLESLGIRSFRIKYRLSLRQLFYANCCYSCLNSTSPLSVPLRLQNSLCSLEACRRWTAPSWFCFPWGSPSSTPSTGRSACTPSRKTPTPLCSNLPVLSKKRT